MSLLNASIFHPLTTMKWTDSGRFHVHSFELCLQCVALRKKIYFLYEDKEYRTKLVSFSDLTSWVDHSLPCQQCSLTTYHTQLVLVGGALPRRALTNALWVSEDDGITWQTSLPPMPTRRSSPTVVNTQDPEYLVVAGGEGGVVNGDWNTVTVKVEVFANGQWFTVQSLPNIVSGGAVLNGYLYLLTDHGFIIHCTLESLLHACRKKVEYTIDDEEILPQVWKRFVALPPVKGTKHHQILAFNNYLIAMVESVHEPAIYAYSFCKKHWKQVFDNIPLEGTYHGSHVGIVVSAATGELVLIGHVWGTNAFTVQKGSLKCMLTFDPDSQFNMNSIKKLDGVGVPVLSPLTQALEDKRLLQALEMVEEYRSLEDMIRFWVNGKGSLPGTWRAMIDVLRDLDYQKESQEIKDYLWSVKSLQELSSSVIMSALLQQRTLDTEKLHASLPHFVPPKIKHSITDSFRAQL